MAGAASLAAKEAERGGLAQGLAAREGEVVKLTRELQVCCRAPGPPSPPTHLCAQAARLCALAARRGDPRAPWQAKIREVESRAAWLQSQRASITQ